jgi:hypothetical protein
MVRRTAGRELIAREHTLTGRVEAEAAWVGYAGIVAEWSAQHIFSGETEHRAVPVTVRSPGAGDDDPSQTGE